jgi:hypothetical protein
MESKIISLENKLSCTVTEKKKAVYNIEELCGELKDDNKRNMEMYLDGLRTYQKSIRICGIILLITIYYILKNNK